VAVVEKMLEKNRCPIHYWITPNHEGPWLIFLHGAGADHKMFTEQVKELDPMYGILMWDARGHGLSRPMGDDFSIKLLVEDLLAIMKIEQIEKATFIGQSMGGNTAQEMVFYYPEKVENLVLIDCACNTWKLSIVEKFAIQMTPFILKLYPWKAMMVQSARASAVKLEVQEYLKDAFATVGKKDFSKIFLETASCLHFEKDYRINKPMLLVCGEHDDTGNIKKTAPQWAKHEPYCEFHWIENASHCSNQDNPAAFNALLGQFLRKFT
jgi:pimeloyl-ACP methyl ester carboxylesterase